MNLVFKYSKVVGDLMTPLEDSLLLLLPSQMHKNLSEETIQAMLHFLVSTSLLLIQVAYTSPPIKTDKNIVYTINHWHFPRILIILWLLHL